MPKFTKHSIVLVFSALLLLAAIPGCRRQEYPTRGSGPSKTIVVTASTTDNVDATENPSPAVSTTPEPQPIAASIAAGQSESGPTPSLEQAGVEVPDPLPYSIYIMTRELPISSSIGGPHQLWRLDSRTTELEMISVVNHDVTAVGIQPGGGRMAYGTSDGAIYLLEEGQEPQLIFQAGLALGERLSISALSWSPSGQQLAFTNTYRDAYSTGKTGGLWLLDMTTRSATQLVGNRHLKAGDTDVSLFREFIDVDYSPDGQALLMKTSFWEYADLLVMQPIAADPTETNLSDPDGWWREGAWTKDSAAILLTEWSQEMSTDLARYRLDEKQVDRLVVGQEDGLFIHYPTHLPGGIAFAGRDSADNSVARLYLGVDHQEGLAYDLAGDGSPLCSGDYVSGIDWDVAGEIALVSCYNNAEIRSLDGSLVIDLTSYLAALYEQQTLELFWAVNQ